MEERRYGRFVVQKTLGVGGMGEVYRAHDDRLGRDVAIKTIRNVAGLNQDVFRSRFMAEARALAAISHPAIVSIHDIGIEGEEPFLILELVDGPSLKELIAEGTRSAAEVRAMGIQIARALASAHARGILHRDLKPANILRGSDGQWKLADFGIARVPDSDLTMTGQFLGTPAYAAPESVLLGQFSEKSDVYSLAATMVEAVTGAKLRDSTGVTELLQRGEVAAELPASVPADLAKALRPALAVDPRNRPSADALASMLASEASGHAIAAAVVPPRSPARAPLRLSRRTRTVALAIGGLLAVGVLAAILAGGGGDKQPAGKAAAPPSRPAPETRDTPTGASRDDREEVDEAITEDDIQAKAQAEFDEIVEKAQQGDVREALEKLDEFEERYGESDGTEQLREDLERAVESSGRGRGRGRGGPPFGD